MALNQFNTDQLIQGARIVGDGRNRGFSDDEILDQQLMIAQRNQEYEELEIQRKQIEAKRAAVGNAGLTADERQMLSEIFNRQKDIRREIKREEQRVKAKRESRIRRGAGDSQITEQQAQALIDRGFEPTREGLASALRAEGIDVNDPRVGEFFDNQQQFEGEKGGFDRNRAFMQRVAQAGNEGDDPNLFQNFGGQIGLGEGNRNVNALDEYFKDLQNAQAENGVTPFDVQRERQQGEVRLPPDALGTIRGVAKRPDSLSAFLEQKFNLNNVDSPDGVFGSTAHEAAVSKKREGLSLAIELQYGLNQGTPEQKAIRREQFNRDLNDLQGEEWKNVDFGGGRQVPDGIARRLIDERGNVRREGGIRDEDGKVLKVVGRDGKERKINVRAKPGKVWGENVAVRDPQRGWIAPQRLGPNGEPLQAIDIGEAGNIRPPAPDQFFQRAPQQIAFGQGKSASKDALGRLQDALIAGEISLDDPISPERFQQLGQLGGVTPISAERAARENLLVGRAPNQKPMTVRELMRQLQGDNDGGVLLEKDRREAAALRARAERRADGQLTPVEVEQLKRKLVNQAIVGPIGKQEAIKRNGVVVLPAVDAEFGAEARGLFQPPAITQASLDQRPNAQLIALGQEISSLPAGPEQERKLQQFRELAIMQRVGAKGPGEAGGVNQFFDPVEVQRGQRATVPSQQFDSEQIREIERLVGQQVDAVVVDGNELGRGRRLLQQGINRAEAAIEADSIERQIIQREQIRLGRELSEGEAQQLLQSVIQEPFQGQRVAGINMQPGEGYQKMDRQMVRGNYQMDLNRFEANLNLVPDAAIGRAEPMLNDGQIVGFMDADSMQTLGESDPAKMAQWDGERWVQPGRQDNGRARNWVENNLFDQYDERRIGDLPDNNWAIGQQIQQPLDELGVKLGQKNAPLRIRNIADFELAMDQHIARKRASRKPKFNVKNPNGPGNIGVFISDIPEDQLFDMALEDLKIPKKNVARALDILDKGMDNTVNDGQIVNLQDKVLFVEGDDVQRRVGMRANQRMDRLIVEGQQAAAQNLGRELTPDEAIQVAAKVRDQRGVKFLERDADIQQIGAARIKRAFFERDENGNLVQNQAGLNRVEVKAEPLIAPLLRELDPNAQLDQEVDARVREVESEMQGLFMRDQPGIDAILGERAARVSPAERRAIRENLALEMGFDDIDVWGPEAKKPFIGAIGDGNRGGVIRQRPGDRQNVAQVIPGQLDTQIFSENLFPDGKRRSRGVALEQIALREREAQRARQQRPALPAAPQRRAPELIAGMPNSPAASARRQADDAMAGIQSEARKRSALTPEQLANLERRGQAAQRGESVQPVQIDRANILREQRINNQLEGFDGIASPRARGSFVADPELAMDKAARLRIERGVAEVDRGRANRNALLAVLNGESSIPNRATSNVTSQPVPGASIIDFQPAERFASQAKQQRDQLIADPWASSSAPASQKLEPIGQAPGVSNEKPSAQEILKKEVGKRKQAPSIDSANSTASNVRPTERRFGDRARGAANQVKAFATKPQYRQGRRVGYGVGGGVLGAIGLDALIGGEREKREEQAVR